MYRIHVVRTLQRPAREVFDILADHEGYGQFPGIDAGILLEPGAETRNGVGALREIRLGRICFRERITVFEPGVRMGYHIEHTRPLSQEHRVGLIELEALGDERTRVTWRSEGRVTLPLIGPLIDKVLQRQGARGFHAVLKATERR